METTENTLFALFQTGLSIHNINKKMEKDCGLSIVQWCLLRALKDAPTISAQLLSETLGVHPSTLTQTLKRLARKGLVFIAEDPKDSRKKLITLTRHGNVTLKKSALNLKVWSGPLTAIHEDILLIQTHLGRMLENG